MPHADTYCSVSECENPSRQGRIRCDFHEKRFQRGQPLTAPKAERLTPNARVLEAAIAMVEAETDEEYAKAERNVLKAAKALGPTAQGALVRQGMEAARKRGVKIGPPFQVDPIQVQEAVTREGSIAAAARALSISRPTVYRALGRVTQPLIALHRAA